MHRRISRTHAAPHSVPIGNASVQYSSTTCPEHHNSVHPPMFALCPIMVDGAWCMLHDVCAPRLCASADPRPLPDGVRRQPRVRAHHTPVLHLQPRRPRYRRCSRLPRPHVTRAPIGAHAPCAAAAPRCAAQRSGICCHRQSFLAHCGIGLASVRRCTPPHASARTCVKRAGVWQKVLPSVLRLSL